MLAARLLLLLASSAIVGAAHASWPQFFDDSDHPGATGNLVKVDSTGSVYVACQANRAGMNPECAIVKYSRAGVLQWSTVYNSANAYENPLGLGVDAQHNVYVTLQTTDRTSFEWGTAKFASTGTFRWIRYHHGANNGIAIPTTLDVTAAGNIVVAGFEDRLPNTFEAAIVEYLPNGMVRWEQTYAPPNHNAYAKGCAIASDGSVAITGFSDGNTGSDVLTLNYDEAGNRRWVASFDGSNHNDDYGNRVAFDSVGNVISAGATTLPVGDSVQADYFAVKYDLGGHKLWQYRTGDSAENEEASFLSVDHADNVLFAGTSGTNITLVKLNDAGQKTWLNHYDGLEGDSAAVAGLLVGGDDSVYVGGTYYDAASNAEQFLLLKYSTDGHRQFVKKVNLNDGRPDILNSIAYDLKTNRVYGTGSGGWDGVSNVALTTRF